MTPDVRTPGPFVLWVLSMLVVSIVVRIGWEIGGKVWSLF